MVAVRGTTRNKAVGTGYVYWYNWVWLNVKIWIQRTLQYCTCWRSVLSFLLPVLSTGTLSCWYSLLCSLCSALSIRLSHLSGCRVQIWRNWKKSGIWGKKLTQISKNLRKLKITQKLAITVKTYNVSKSLQGGNTGFCCCNVMGGSCCPDVAPSKRMEVGRF